MCTTKGVRWSRERSLGRRLATEAQKKSLPAYPARLPVKILSSPPAKKRRIPRADYARSHATGLSQPQEWALIGLVYRKSRMTWNLTSGAKARK